MLIARLSNSRRRSRLFFVLKTLAFTPVKTVKLFFRFCWMASSCSMLKHPSHFSDVWNLQFYPFCFASIRVNCLWLMKFCHFFYRFPHGLNQSFFPIVINNGWTCRCEGIITPFFFVCCTGCEGVWSHWLDWVSRRRDERHRTTMNNGTSSSTTAGGLSMQQRSVGGGVGALSFPSSHSSSSSSSEHPHSSQSHQGPPPPQSDHELSALLEYSAVSAAQGSHFIAIKTGGFV